MHVLTTALLTVFLACLLGGCKEEKQPVENTNTIEVTVFTTKVDDVPWPGLYPGKTVGSKSVEVRARVNGIIEERCYQEGDFVKAGQVLFRIEKDRYEAAVQEAQASYNNALREWNRIRPLFAKNAVSQKNRDEALSERDRTEAALRQAKIDLEYCTVVAPVSGSSGKETMTSGNLVNNNDLLTSINQVDPTFVDFAIPSRDSQLRKHLHQQGRLAHPKENKYTARIQLLSGAMYPEQGKVSFIDSRVLTDTAAIRARAIFSNAQGIILPGQHVQLTIYGDVLLKAILVPKDCILETQQGSTVMIVDNNNTIHARAITHSVQIGDNVLVDTGLSGGERLVLEGLAVVKEGTQAKISSDEGTQKASNTAKGGN
ncbi:MAG: efflux RND transporter periplasmic adaptor subunit [Desulfovibrio sp.]|nr:efflux RND transporter periplasmic adaptor subunit [Desulfovibrio sp.]